MAYARSMASNLEGATLKPDGIIFDEVGQATEGDLMMAITPHVSKLSLLVLAGGTAQLRPTVRSATHNIYSNLLSTSAMLRIKQDPDITCMKLTQNFRGHPSTWDMSSRLVYSGEITAGRNPTRWDESPIHAGMMSLLQSADMRPAYVKAHLALGEENRQFFFDVHGLPLREEESTSWWNPKGVEAIVSFVKYIIITGAATVEDIGIISMYGEDVRRIRQRLEANDLAVEADGKLGIKAATIDSYQGGQMNIMLLHLVAAFEIPRNPFGLVKEPGRLSVATTRAKYFQFLVGNLKYWRAQQKRHVKEGEKGTERNLRKMSEMCDYIERKGQVVEWSNVPEEITQCSVDVPAELLPPCAGMVPPP